MDTVGEGESGMDGESSINIDVLSGGRWTAGENVAQGAQPGALWWPAGMGWVEDTEAGKRGDVCIIMADLHCCMAETIKIKDKKIKDFWN